MKKLLKYIFYATIFSIIIYKSTGTDWSNIRYWVAVADGQKTVLDNVISRLEEIAEVGKNENSSNVCW